MTGGITKTDSAANISTFDGIDIQVRSQGPNEWRTVVLLDALSDDTPRYSGVLSRLQVAKVRTVVIASHQPVAVKAVIDVLDTLNVPSAVLVGDRAEAETAWRTTAHHPERISGLVVIDGGHPKTPSVSCTVCENQCPPVLANTTALVSTTAAKSIARASRHYVRGDFRIAELVGRRGSREFTAQLSTEIVLRALSV